jgi:hypothetical protein
MKVKLLFAIKKIKTHVKRNMNFFKLNFVRISCSYFLEFFNFCFRVVLMLTMLMIFRVKLSEKFMQNFLI